MRLKYMIGKIELQSNVKVKLMLISTLTLILLLIVDVFSAFASRRYCFYDGRRYPDGYILGNLKCNDGTWVRID